MRPLRLAAVLLLGACSISETPTDATVSPSDASSSDAAGFTDAQLPDAGRRDAALPPAPEDWAPPFPVSPEPWRESTEPHCADYPGRIQGLDVWADERGVFLLSAVFNNHFAPGDPQIPSGYSVMFNPGDGWQTWRTQEALRGFAPPQRLIGRPGAELYATGGSCAIELISGPGLHRCDYLGDIREGHTIDVWPMGEDSGWALTSTNIRLRVDGEWTRYRSFDGEAGREIWGDPGQVSVLTSDDLYTTDPGLHPREDIPSGFYATFWANARDDLWVAADGGRILHFTGTRDWTTYDIGSETPRDLWGDGERLYFVTAGSLGYIEGNEVHVVEEWPPERLVGTSIWGTDDGGVFLSVQDDRYIGHRCGAEFLLWFDGEVFHRI